ncbi:hypothetical protein [Aestuariibaculum sediminum]|uniref:DUF481 domain-containing protein n=1 Tax=Aestuariibaculum sediminum TaxID=2770637 RepID=A0A8J6UHZ7_9FLAO|nr:hypothetical protein [Aestuariibaculum sediminum]MBD0833596.1 hypothetical protein [Aestuariibaculum sediminum]
MNKYFIIVVVLLVNTIYSSAQDSIVNKTSHTRQELPNWYSHKYEIHAGAFFPLNNTQVRVGSTTSGKGSLLDLEDNLGFSKYTTSFYGTFSWQVSKRSRFDLNYFYLSRSSRYTIDKDIVFGENTYNADAQIEAFFNTQILRFSYGYAIFNKPKYQIGALIGTHILFGNIGLRAETNVGSGEIKDNLDFTAPLPDLGLWNKFLISKKLALYSNMNYLSLKINNISGRILSYNASVSYSLIPNLNLNLGYTGLNFRVDIEKERLNGFLKWGYNGPTITAMYSFN